MNRRFFVRGAAAVAILQSGAVGAMIYNRARKIETGKEVILESRFVDPRDLFRGHYVTLNLVAGDLDREEIETDGEFGYGAQVYVELEKGEGLFWTARKLWKEIPPGSDAAFLKGEISAIPSGDNTRYRIRFPFDRYFAPRLRAQELEKFRQDQQLGVVLALDEAGNGYIKGITVEGEVIYDEPLY